MHDPRTDTATDWEGLSVIALATAAIVIPIVVGWAMSTLRSTSTFWFCIAASGGAAAAGTVRSIRIIRSRQTRRGMALVGLGISLPILVLDVLWGPAILALTFMWRNWTF